MQSFVTFLVFFAADQKAITVGLGQLNGQQPARFNTIVLVTDVIRENAQGTNSGGAERVHLCEAQRHSDTPNNCIKTAASPSVLSMLLKKTFFFEQSG